MLYTIIVFSENKPGVLYRIADLFLRRRINIESMTVSEIKERELSRFTITVDADGALVEKIVKQIYRIIEVLKVIDATDADLVIQEVALIRVSANTPEKRKHIKDIVALTGTRVMYISKTEITLSVTGTEGEVKNVHALCLPYGVKEYVRSGRIAVLKNEDHMKGKFTLEMEKGKNE